MLTSPDSTPEERRLALRRRSLAVLAALAISVGAVACGSDDDSGSSGDSSETTTTETLSKDEFLKQVNAAQVAFANNAAKLNLADPSSPEGFGSSLGKLDGLIVKLQARLDDIAEPTAVATQMSDLVQLLKDYSAVIRSQKGELTSGDPEKVQAAAEKVGKASTTFSQEFDATVREINEALGLEASTETDGK